MMPNLVRRFSVCRCFPLSSAFLPSLALGRIIRWCIGLLLFLSLLSGETAQAQDRRTYRSGETWASRFLEDGGDISQITGLKRPLNWREEVEWDDITVTRDLPAMFDWRWKANGLQPIRNQKSCGSCWAFSVTATLEALIRIQTGKLVDLAEQTLVSTCSNSGDCGGGYFSALNYMKMPGLPDESQDPYLARNSSCKSGLRPAEKIVRWAYVGSRERGPSIEQIKTALITKGPLSVTVYANSAMTSYQGGIFNSCANATPNHMVNLEGWNDDGQYWIMRNSWGTSWGQNGYMNIRYTSNSGIKCSQIGEAAAYAVYGDGLPDAP